MLNKSTFAYHKGFTLIELLVVIAIISILAAILFPVFARAREGARAASCLSNVKQIGLAIEQYKQDYDGYYPFSRSVTPAKDWYDGYLDPYIKGKPVSRCPSAPDNWPISYSYNINFGYFPGKQVTPSRAGTIVNYSNGCGDALIYDGINEAGVQEPSNSISVVEASLTYYYLRETVGYSDATAITQLSFFNPPGPGNPIDPAVMINRYMHEKAGIHNGGLNVLYADGHAKKKNLSSLMEFTQWCSIKR